MLITTTKCRNPNLLLAKERSILFLLSSERLIAFTQNKSVRTPQLNRLVSWRVFCPCILTLTIFGWNISIWLIESSIADDLKRFVMSVD